MPDKCRNCQSPLVHDVVDLGLSPVSNHFRELGDAVNVGQTFYPLVARVCTSCWLVQLTDVETPPHFDEDYAYFSSFSKSWLEHAKSYASQMTEDLSLGSNSLVVELASNDGYLLQYFKNAGVPVLGVEPSANVAQYAKDNHGIDCITDFFGRGVADEIVRRGQKADLVVANNVLAHVPDINDFIAGVAKILTVHGTATFEFPHLMRMLTEGQFDTIYHEHFFYLSLLAVEKIFATHGLSVHGVEELPTHGGSLRVYASHTSSGVHDKDLARTRDKIRTEEAAFGVDRVESYAQFSQLPAKCKSDLLAFFIDARKQGKTVCGYGAPAKGNTLLNYCGIGPEFLPFTSDMSPQKQSKLLPGLNIPVHAPEVIDKEKPDYILILPWNLREEIAGQLAHTREWGAQFVVAIPELEVF
ncbi:class I SAM-dependent methyltransferase [Aliiroseovarius sp. KMU-50]|uniref:Class I SAM-dependent methyltransferase n=1 Tax=Aliiroseovarius salicola TaxID=3009082 RepID=A0ABT4W5E3_9RHOB|nr:class I SAM-dependent methyltransferase [Aliiroseovarius sp. KMU-50]MDA5095738.1 class I SAM-dependent methyltransferase [Aliiroseovarius sp. KMU-50]